MATLKLERPISTPRYPRQTRAAWQTPPYSMESYGSFSSDTAQKHRLAADDQPLFVTRTRIQLSVDARTAIEYRHRLRTTKYMGASTPLPGLDAADSDTSSPAPTASARCPARRQHSGPTATQTAPPTRTPPRCPARTAALIASSNSGSGAYSCLPASPHLDLLSSRLPRTVGLPPRSLLAY